MASSILPPINPNITASAAEPRTSSSRPTPPPPSPPLVHLSFSHDSSCFIAADASAAHWLCCDTFRLRGLYQEKDASRTIAVAGGDMLDRKASICAVVSRVAAGPDSGTKFAVRRWTPGFLNYHWRYKDKQMEITGGDVRAVHVHRHKTVLVHDGHADVYDTSSGLLHHVETESNPLGLCAVAQGPDAPFAFACPGVKVGEVHVERWVEEMRPLSISAHSSRLACMAMSWDGRLVATASVRGTLVRVFRAADGTLLRELRRGTDRADIHCIAFSPDSKWLAVSSNKATVHIFSVNVDLTSSAPENGDGPDDLQTPPAPSTAGKANQGSSLSFLRGFLPGYFSSEWSLAQFRLREGIKYLVAFGQQPNTVLIIGMDGSFYRCQFDPEKGGDMTQLEYRNFMNIRSGSEMRD